MTKKFEAIDGSKVHLAQFQVTDITSDYISWLNDPEVVRYSNQRFIRHSEESCLHYLGGFRNTNNLFISLQLKESHSMIGTMTAYVSPHHRTVDVGIMIGKRTTWGSGLGQDAWDTLLDWLIDNGGIRKITAGTLACNKAMVKLLERSGMILEAVRPRQELLDGVPQDILYYGKFIDS